MIYLIGKVANFYRKTPILSFFQTLKSQGIPTKIILPTHLYNWEKLKRFNFSKKDFSSIQEIICQRDSAEASCFGLKDLGLEKYQLIRGKNFYFIDNEYKTKAKVSFFDARNTLIKEVTYTDTGRIDEFDDRGFVFSKTIATDEKKLFLDKEEQVKITYFYQNQRIKKIVLSSGETFFSESEFFAWELSQLIKNAQEDDRFLLFDVHEIYPFLSEDICNHSQLYLVPDFTVEQASLLTGEGKNPNGVILESEKEIASYRLQSFYKNSSFPLYACNYFTTENLATEETEEVVEKKIFLNLGNLADKEILEGILHTLLKLGEKLDLFFILELQGSKNTIFVREYIASHSAEKFFQLAGNPYTKTLDNMLEEVSVYLLLDSQKRASLSLMKAISYGCYLLVPEDSLYADWIKTQQLGKVLKGEKSHLIFQSISLLESQITANLVNDQFFSKKNTAERIMKQLYVENWTHKKDTI